MPTVSELWNQPYSASLRGTAYLHMVLRSPWAYNFNHALQSSQYLFNIKSTETHKLISSSESKQFVGKCLLTKLISPTVQHDFHASPKHAIPLRLIKKGCGCGCSVHIEGCNIMTIPFEILTSNFPIFAIFIKNQCV